MRRYLDLKHVGLIVSAGGAVGMRIFSDFSLATIQFNATAAGIDLSQLTPTVFGALVARTLLDLLQRDWFNLTPFAPIQAGLLVAGLLVLYALLRRALAPEKALGTVLFVTVFAPLIASVAACVLLVGRLARTG